MKAIKKYILVAVVNKNDMTVIMKQCIE